MTAEAYPANPAERTRWIVAKRGQRNEVRVDRPYAFFEEEERNGAGEIARVATIFLTNRECPWKCAMCDLWRNTTVERVPAGAIAGQIEYALNRLDGTAHTDPLPSAGRVDKTSVIKLYNSGSFFDVGAIGRSEWRSIAALCAEFSHVIVECHPRLIGNAVPEFAALLRGTLEVAMGLETCHPEALEGLNKRFTIGDYQRAASFLGDHEIAMRTFLLVHPPFIERSEQRHWLRASIRFSFDAGANVVSLIPTRLGNGTLEKLGVEEPDLDELEEAQEFGITLAVGRVFADTWDLGRFASCVHCAEARTRRVARMNLSQQLERRVSCAVCGN